MIINSDPTRGNESIGQRSGVVYVVVKFVMAICDRDVFEKRVRGAIYWMEIFWVGRQSIPQCNIKSVDRKNNINFLW